MAAPANVQPAPPGNVGGVFAALGAAPAPAPAPGAAPQAPGPAPVPVPSALLPTHAVALWSVVNGEVCVESGWHAYLAKYEVTQVQNLAKLGTAQSWDDISAAMATIKQAKDAKHLAGTDKQADVHLLQEIGLSIVKAHPDDADLVSDWIDAADPEGIRRQLRAAFERLMRAAKGQHRAEAPAQPARAARPKAKKARGKKGKI